MVIIDVVLCCKYKKLNLVFFIIVLVLFFLGCCVMVNGLILCINFLCNIFELGGYVFIILWILNFVFNFFVYVCLKKDIKREFIKFI